MNELCCHFFCFISLSLWCHQVQRRGGGWWTAPKGDLWKKEPGRGPVAVRYDESSSRRPPEGEYRNSRWLPRHRERRGLFVFESVGTRPPVNAVKCNITCAIFPDEIDGSVLVFVCSRTRSSGAVFEFTTRKRVPFRPEVCLVFMALTSFCRLSTSDFLPDAYLQVEGLRNSMKILCFS